MKLFAFILTISLIFSCSSTEEVIKDEVTDTIETVAEDAQDAVDETKPERNVKMKAEIGEFKDSDPLTIQSAKIVDNSLFLTVNFSGGCAEHKFSFIGSPMIMKSLPPKRSVKLIHDKNDDSCRSIVTKVLEIDLKNIAYKQESGSELVLLLEGWKGELKYTFL